MYLIRPNEQYRKLLSERSQRQSLDLPQYTCLGKYPDDRGDLGNLYVIDKLERLAVREYDSLEEVLDAINSIGHMEVPSLGRGIGNESIKEAERYPIYQISPKVLIGEVVKTAHP